MKYRLREFANINLKTIAKKYARPIYYMDTSSVYENNFLKPVKYDSIINAPSRARRIGEKGDTIISTVRPNMHHIGFIDEKLDNYVFSTGFAVVHPNSEIIEPFYLYLLLSLRKTTDILQNIGETSTSAYPSVKPSDIENLEFNIPSIVIQKDICNKFIVIERKISENKQINDNLSHQLKLLFQSLYTKALKNNEVTLGALIKETLSGDWGRPTLQDKFKNRVTIIRGTDLSNLSNGDRSQTPIRYIKDRVYENKKSLLNDVLVEISGGSPTQSTGRSLFISQSLINKFNTELLGTNFTRIFRPYTENDGILFKSYLDFLYDRNVFFNYENGTTGIKNLDYKSVLNIQLPDITTCIEYGNYLETFKKFNTLIQANGSESALLNKIKRNMLDKYF